MNPQQVAQVLVPVTNIDSAIRFYTESLGLVLKFRDGDRYAALDGGAVTVALLAEGERVAGDRVALAFRVGNLTEHLDLITGAHAPIEEGPHELRAVLHDPDGNPVVVSQKV